MTDIKDILEQATRSQAAPPTADTVEADVRRGRAALARLQRRRKVRRSVIGVAAASALVVGAVAIGNLGDDPGDSPPAAHNGPTTDKVASPNTVTQVDLVSYDGRQLDGFVVDRAPEGWYLQGSNSQALTIAPEGTSNTEPLSFNGKLVVMLLSSHAPAKLPQGEPVTVGGERGTVNRHAGAETTTLTYDDGEGHLVQVQSPKVLGWSNEQLAKFAEGVEVTADAKAGLG